MWHLSIQENVSQKEECFDTDSKAVNFTDLEAVYSNYSEALCDTAIRALCWRERAVDQRWWSTQLWWSASQCSLRPLSGGHQRWSPRIRQRLGSIQGPVSTKQLCLTLPPRWTWGRFYVRNTPNGRCGPRAAGSVSRFECAGAENPRTAGEVW